MEPIIKEICSLHNLPFYKWERVHGGDSNQAFVIKTENAQYFLKLNVATTYPSMFQREAEGLHALRQQPILLCPEVMATGVAGNYQYLLLQHLIRVIPGDHFWEVFAQGIAALHQINNDAFGWHSGNYIGSLVQTNEWSNKWATFYTNQRIIPLVKSLFDRLLFDKSDVQAVERICKRLPEIFPAEPPSLLHGDFWNGNFMATHNADKNIVPAVYDPAVYFGHREMDLGMSLLFGGFDDRFYDAYKAAFPLENDWKKRVPITQLYLLLVHAILFESNYITQCKTIIKKWGS